MYIGCAFFVCCETWTADGSQASASIDILKLITHLVYLAHCRGPSQRTFRQNKADSKWSATRHRCGATRCPTARSRSCRWATWCSVSIAVREPRACVLPGRARLHRATRPRGHGARRAADAHAHQIHHLCDHIDLDRDMFHVHDAGGQLCTRRCGCGAGSQIAQHYAHISAHLYCGR